VLRAGNEAGLRGWPKRCDGAEHYAEKEEHAPPKEGGAAVTARRRLIQYEVHVARAAKAHEMKAPNNSDHMTSIRSSLSTPPCSRAGIGATNYNVTVDV
jgi:hypothetical protein